MLCLRHPLPSAQKGIVLLITLLVLVAMTLASVGMMRSVDTSVAAVGNLAFRQAADAAVNLAIEQVVRDFADPALGWTVPGNTDASNPGIGYYASIQPNENGKGIPARLQTSAGTGVNTAAQDAAGNITQTMVERMCNQPGPASAANCLGQAGVAEDSPSKAGELVALTLGNGGGFSAYYRVTVRVNGPNNTVSFAQAIINL